jgi:hypothetical protein
MPSVWKMWRTWVSTVVMRRAQPRRRLAVREPLGDELDQGELALSQAVPAERWSVGASGGWSWFADLHECADHQVVVVDGSYRAPE